MDEIVDVLLFFKLIMNSAFKSVKHSQVLNWGQLVEKDVMLGTHADGFT